MLRRRAAACTVALTAALAAGCHGPTTTLPTPSPFVVMSCNVRYGTAKDGPDAWPERRDHLVRVVRDTAPAVLGVQEALHFQLDFLQQHLPFHRRLGQGREGGTNGEHCALFIDLRRFEVVQSGDFWLSPTPEVVASVGWDAALPRICTWAELREVGSGRRLTAWNVHLDHRGAEARRRSAELVAARLAALPGPHVVLGDFNAGEHSEPLAALRAAGLRDTFRDVAPMTTAVGTFHGFRGGDRGEKIDYALASAGLRTEAAAILNQPGPNGRWPSDHHFVAATLRFEAEAAAR